MKFILLTRGQVAIVDNEDYQWLMQWVWYAMTNGYAARRNKPDFVLMHRAVLERKLGRRLQPGELCDHINNNTLDNRRSNLRIAAAKENGQNRGKHKAKSSKFKGVSWRVDHGKWSARIKHGSRNVFLGYFDKEEDAARAYDNAASQLYGQFAKTNKGMRLL